MYDLIFISYKESNADSNFEKIKKRFPTVKRIHGIEGIHQAHIYAAKKSLTKMFWAIDGDALIEDDFDFSYTVDEWDLNTVHVWKSKNPINGLIYGYGGVKLLPTSLTLSMTFDKLDVTTSISESFKLMPDVSNITAFNTDPFSTWRSAFRECAKLASKTIDRQLDTETEERLSVWCNVGKDSTYGQYAIDGALQGLNYGTDNKDNLSSLSLINNFKWLREKFDETYSVRMQ